VLGNLLMKKILKASDVVNSYEPTHEDRARLVKKPHCFKLSGDGVFHSIQGEGPFMGQPTTFIRLHFCNLCCNYCDSFYTWLPKSKEYWKEPFDISVHDLHAEIRKAQEQKGIKITKHVYSITFTGGEPLLHKAEIEEFMRLYPQYKVQIETNGTIMPSDYLLEHAYFNCSPKLSNSGNLKTRRINTDVICKLRDVKTYFKFVCRNDQDIDEMLLDFGIWLQREQIWIMPEGVLLKENAQYSKQMMSRILSEGFNISPRLQNLLFGGAKRRV